MPHYQWCFWRYFETFFKWWNVYLNTDSATPVMWRTKYWRHHPVNNNGCWLKNIKLVFELTINIQSVFKWPLTTNPHFVCNVYKPVCFQNRISFGELMLASSTWLLGLVVMEQFRLSEKVMWYKYMWLESRWKSEKVRKAYEISYNDGLITFKFYTLRRIFFDVSLTVKAAPHECVIRTGLP